MLTLCLRCSSPVKAPLKTPSQEPRYLSEEPVHVTLTPLDTSTTRNEATKEPEHSNSNVIGGAAKTTGEETRLKRGFQPLQVDIPPLLMLLKNPAESKSGSKVVAGDEKKKSSSSPSKSPSKGVMMALNSPMSPDYDSPRDSWSPSTHPSPSPRSRADTSTSAHCPGELCEMSFLDHCGDLYAPM